MFKVLKEIISDLVIGVFCAGYGVYGGSLPMVLSRYKCFAQAIMISHGQQALVQSLVDDE